MAEVVLAVRHIEVLSEIFKHCAFGASDMAGRSPLVSSPRRGEVRGSGMRGQALRISLR